MNPYYIVAPRYTNTSAGVRVLYRLCHLLNLNGYPSYIYLRPHFPISLASSPNDIAPFLTKKIRDFHYESNLTPIIIYPETILISKLNPPFRVPYFLNYHNLLFQKDSIENDDYILTYSQNILSKIKSKLPSSVIFLPVSDHNFYKPNNKIKRNGNVFYAGKFKYHFSGKTLDLTNGMIEITRDKFNSQTKEEIRYLFQSSEAFYCYEDSALALEAILCECPVIFIPNEYFKECLGAKELKSLGFAWGNNLKEINHAKKTVSLARKRYIWLLKDSEKSVKNFINETQILSKNTKYKVPFAKGYLNSNIFENFFSFIQFIKEYIQDNGFKIFIKTIYKRIINKRFKI